jgi:exopolysaccharide production protein ExoY
MSIVGPRPIVTAEIEKYGSHFSDFCAVRPGITGAWQVNGRSSTSYEERVALDVDYIRNATLSDDIWIVLKTVVVVLKRDGAC